MSLEDIPTWFSDYMDISLDAAQALLSIIVILAVILPIMYLARGRNLTPIIAIMLFLTEATLVGIGWLPFWLLIATVAVMALAVAFLTTGIITGR